MRQICLDTETTGMHALGGDRIVEIGCVGIFGRTLSDKENTMFHVYINPERDVPEEVVRVHGLTTEFLSDKPVFADIVDDFLAFIEGAELIIHNAEFDVGFLNAELKRLGKGTIEAHCAAVTDSLEMAKKMFPGLRNNLDRLCDRFEIDRSGRTLHGALLDARLLAEVYLAMTREQGELLGESYMAGEQLEELPDTSLLIRAVCPPEDLAAHEKLLDLIDGKAKKRGGSIWRAPAGSADTTA